MSAMQDQFATFAKQSQDAVTGVVRTWAEQVQGLSGLPTVPGSGVPDLMAAVDNAFDIAEQVLAMQRELTKAFLRAVTLTLPDGRP